MAPGILFSIVIAVLLETEGEGSRIKKPGHKGRVN